MRKVAELLVWDQAGRCFRLTDDGPVGSNGLPCEVGEESIKLAHPMEMKPEEVTAWQKHFTEHGLKQPFQQIWEPVYDYFGETVRADRYQDCRIDPVYLKNQGRRGIECEWYDRDYYGSKYLRIRGFLVSAKDAPWQEGDKREHLMIYSLRPERWNRRANNVIAFLDRITMYDRIKKDDVSVMELMDRFTLAQVTEFIKAAQEANAVNVLAALMDYKNTHFAEFDPMDEFVLE